MKEFEKWENKVEVFCWNSCCHEGLDGRGLQKLIQSLLNRIEDLENIVHNRKTEVVI